MSCDYETVSLYFDEVGKTLNVGMPTAMMMTIWVIKFSQLIEAAFRVSGTPLYSEDLVGRRDLIARKLGPQRLVCGPWVRCF